jgi:hypothetical protein
VQRVRGHPRVEGDQELGAEAAYRDRLLLRAIQSESNKPGIEGGGIEIAERDGRQIIAGGDIAQARRLGNVDA